ncbi:hypothetical protein FDUTEX481_01176 [Tolypothrix sp. PCC 7601]|nr:hypothetical protein FDUTEX481_01176 [Tolypothrix sp. PCC 7601]BAY91833.1 hypothetical protein NIES3275_38600 [Microchaete diplosiphon NIES-3275]
MLWPLPRSRGQVIMDLEAQIQLLIDNAPHDGITPQLVTAIAPALKAIAHQLSHSQYYILQSVESEWVLTTLSNRANPRLEKHVIYAFPTLKDASLASSAGVEEQVIATEIPVTHILFQLVALETVDSIVFFETSGMSTNAVEVQRSDLQNRIQQQLQKKRSPRQVPPDIA